MILDEVLKEQVMLESMTEAQQEYVVEAYNTGYIMALESYIATIEEEHKTLPKDVIEKIKARAQDRLDKAREALQKTKLNSAIGNKSATEAKLKYNGAYKSLARVKAAIENQRKQHAFAG